MKLIEHRKNLNSNPNAYQEDIQNVNRLVNTMIIHLRKEYKKTKFDKSKKK
jgi:hypothetical protein